MEVLGGDKVVYVTETEVFDVVDGRVEGTLKYMPRPGTLVFRDKKDLGVFVRDDLLLGSLKGSCLPDGRIEYVTHRFSFRFGRKGIHPDIMEATYQVGEEDIREGS